MYSYPNPDAPWVARSPPAMALAMFLSSNINDLVQDCGNSSTGVATVLH